jgi:hypothetical protein
VFAEAAAENTDREVTMLGMYRRQIEIHRATATTLRGL